MLLVPHLVSVMAEAHTLGKGDTWIMAAATQLRRDFMGRAG